MSFHSKVEMVIQRHRDVVINLATFFPLKNGKMVKNLRDLCHCTNIIVILNEK
jgi:hypothetical protein